MELIYIEQISVNPTDSITYETSGDTLIIEMDKEGKEYTDSFDFSSFIEDGELLLRNFDGEETIETLLPINPVLKVLRKEGTLYIEVLEWIRDSSFDEKPSEEVEVNEGDFLNVDEESSSDLNLEGELSSVARIFANLNTTTSEEEVNQVVQNFFTLTEEMLQVEEIIDEEGTIHPLNPDEVDNVQISENQVEVSPDPTVIDEEVPSDIEENTIISEEEGTGEVSGEDRSDSVDDSRGSQAETGTTGTGSQGEGGETTELT